MLLKCITNIICLSKLRINSKDGYMAKMSVQERKHSLAHVVPNSGKMPTSSTPKGRTSKPRPIAVIPTREYDGVSKVQSRNSNGTIENPSIQTFGTGKFLRHSNSEGIMSQSGPMPIRSQSVDKEATSLRMTSAKRPQEQTNKIARAFCRVSSFKGTKTANRKHDSVATDAEQTRDLQRKSINSKTLRHGGIGNNSPRNSVNLADIPDPVNEQSTPRRQHNIKVSNGKSPQLKQSRKFGAGSSKPQRSPSFTNKTDLLKSNDPGANVSNDLRGNEKMGAENFSLSPNPIHRSKCGMSDNGSANSRPSMTSQNNLLSVTSSASQLSLIQKIIDKRTVLKLDLVQSSPNLESIDYCDSPVEPRRLSSKSVTSRYSDSQLVVCGRSEMLENLKRGESVNSFRSSSGMLVGGSGEDSGSKKHLPDVIPREGENTSPIMRRRVKKKIFQDN